jgi:double-stranded uracil-DNA glycosylase
MNDDLRDVIANHLDVLFCGINPSVDAATTGHHFVGRSNRFWRVLHLAGFTSKEISPQQDRSILRHGYGITSVVARPTASAEELSSHEFKSAAIAFERKIIRYAPRIVAFLGKAGYAGISAQRHVQWGHQPKHMLGAVVWVLPNPSGRNRAFTLEQLVQAYRALYVAMHEMNAERVVKK